MSTKMRTLSTQKSCQSLRSKFKNSCMPFNNKGICTRPYCAFTHRCLECNSNMPRFRCTNCIEKDKEPYKRHICVLYNRDGVCNRADDKMECHYAHICYRCLGDHPMSECLVEEVLTPSETSSGINSNGSNTFSNTSNSTTSTKSRNQKINVCFGYNTIKGCYRNPCQRPHKCVRCYENHPRYECRDNYGRLERVPLCKKFIENNCQHSDSEYCIYKHGREDRKFDKVKLFKIDRDKRNKQNMNHDMNKPEDTKELINNSNDDTDIFYDTVDLLNQNIDHNNNDQSVQSVSSNVSSELTKLSDPKMSKCEHKNHTKKQPEITLAIKFLLLLISILLIIYIIFFNFCESIFDCLKKMITFRPKYYYCTLRKMLVKNNDPKPHKERGHKKSVHFDDKRIYINKSYRNRKESTTTTCETLSCFSDISSISSNGDDDGFDSDYQAVL